jgi:hypothetical protein
MKISNTFSMRQINWVATRARLPEERAREFRDRLWEYGKAPHYFTRIYATGCVVQRLDRKTQGAVSRAVRENAKNKEALANWAPIATAALIPAGLCVSELVQIRADVDPFSAAGTLITGGVALCVAVVSLVPILLANRMRTKAHNLESRITIALSEVEK